MDKASELNSLAKHMAGGEFETVIKLSTKLLSENPDYARFYGFRGLANFELVISNLEQVINDVTVKSMSLQNTSDGVLQESTLNGISAQWTMIYKRIRGFCVDLEHAIGLNESIYFDFDKISTESFRKHWDEGISRFLNSTLKILEKHKTSQFELYKKNHENLTNKITVLFEKLENPPENLIAPENYLTSASIISSREKDIKVVDFDESLVDLNLEALANSGVLGKSDHIVAFTMNSIIESQLDFGDQDHDGNSDNVSLTQKLLGLADDNGSEDNFLNMLKPMKDSDKLPEKLKPLELDLPESSVTMTDIGIQEQSFEVKSEEVESPDISDSFDPGETMTDISIPGSFEYKEDEDLGVSHELLHIVRTQFDEYCKTTKGHKYPDLSEILEPQKLTRRFFYIFEYQLLYQIRNLSWEQKNYEDETPGKTNFNEEELDKWAYTKNIFNFENGKFTRSVTESYNLIECSNCKGKGVLTCQNCNGSGRIQCDMCDGMGAYPPKADKLTSPCPQCNSSGGVQCPECNKDGVIECSVCKGQKHVLKYLDLEIEQKNNRKYMYHPSKYLPGNADVRKLKEQNEHPIFSTEYDGFPDLEELQLIFPEELASTIKEFCTKIQHSQKQRPEIKLCATKLSIYEIEIINLEYTAEIEEYASDKVYTVDLVLDDNSIYPGIDPHKKYVNGLRKDLSTTLESNDIRQSKRIIKDLSSILGKDDELTKARFAIKKKARTDYLISLLPASIIELMVIFFFPLIFSYYELLKNVYVFVIPVVIVTFIISVILRNVFITFASSFIKRFMFLTLISSSVSVVGLIGLLEINETLVENFVNWCNNHIFNLFLS